MESVRVGDRVLFALSRVREEIYEGKLSNDHYNAEKRILEHFRAMQIPESEYEPYMCNNVLMEISLK